MSFDAATWLQLRPGALRWLETLAQRGYVLGSDLAEGEYLQSDPDGSVNAEKILLALEAEGYIRRGDIRPSHSQLAFDSLGNMARRNRKALPPTWFAWLSHKDWSVVNVTRPERCDFCDTGKCWAHV